MKNVSSLKSNTTNSPKTPGGISKSLLTPCRRVGLSRNWINKGSSPFISPLSGNVPEVKEEKIEKIGTRKRKERVLDDNIDKTPETCNVIENEIDYECKTDINKTPSRIVEVPRRKKSKTLLCAINKSQEETKTDSITMIDAACTVSQCDEQEQSIDKPNAKTNENTDMVSTPVRSKSKKSKKHSPALKANQNIKISNCHQKPDVSNSENIDNVENQKDSTDVLYNIKEKSPNDLRKECIVVIQRKIFKKSTNIDVKEKQKKDKDAKSSSQALFDSDSDDLPLNQLNNKVTTQSKIETTNDKADSTVNLDEDCDDFVGKSTKVHVTKLKDTKSPKNKLKTTKSIQRKVEKVKVQPKPPSQSCFDDDDDDFDNKKTILIRKTYEKVTKPLKAKSTGSITQRDIDEIKARIETKKKLLLAKAISPDTEELRTLIKKWQKGCQDALMELLDLMKTKFQDRQNMDYSEMLKTLKIPPALVGYDSENDCFNSPDDASIILGPFKDI